MQAKVEQLNQVSTCDNYVVICMPRATFWIIYFILYLYHSNLLRRNRFLSISSWESFGMPWSTFYFGILSIAQTRTAEKLITEPQFVKKER